MEAALNPTGRPVIQPKGPDGLIMLSKHEGKWQMQQDNAPPHITGRGALSCCTCRLPTHLPTVPGNHHFLSSDACSIGSLSTRAVSTCPLHVSSHRHSSCKTVAWLYRMADVIVALLGMLHSVYSERRRDSLLAGRSAGGECNTVNEPLYIKRRGALSCCTRHLPTHLPTLSTPT